MATETFSGMKATLLSQVRQFFNPDWALNLEKSINKTETWTRIVCQCVSKHKLWQEEDWETNFVWYVELSNPYESIVLTMTPIYKLVKHHCTIIVTDVTGEESGPHINELLKHRPDTARYLYISSHRQKKPHQSSRQSQSDNETLWLWFRVEIAHLHSAVIAFRWLKRKFSYVQDFLNGIQIILSGVSVSVYHMLNILD